MEIKVVFSEDQKQLRDIYGDYDVVIAGGGIAGIAAAISAARCNKHVLLIERMYVLGGLATAGLVTIYLPLCDGKGHQVSFGLAEELLKLSISKGCERDYPSTWMDGSCDHGRERYQVRFNAQVFAILAEQLVLKSGVDILYGTQICSVLRSGDSIEAIVVENKDGRNAIPATCFVDATGDADLFEMAGADTAIYKRGNIPAAWFYETVDGKNMLHMLGAADIVSSDDDAVIPDEITSSRISGLDAKENSDAVIRCHGLLLEKFLANGDVSETHSLSAIASIPQLRMTRRIAGAYVLDEKEDHVSFYDSVGLVGDWRKRGPVFEIPFRTLYSQQIRNMLAAGRCISVTDDMWDITRVIPAAAVTGEAAGIAAAYGSDVRCLDVTKLQAHLRTNGIPFHIEDLD